LKQQNQHVHTQQQQQHDSTQRKRRRKKIHLVSELQKCWTPTDVLHWVGRRVVDSKNNQHHYGNPTTTGSTSMGEENVTTTMAVTISSLILVRLSKQMIAVDNKGIQGTSSSSSSAMEIFVSNNDNRSILAGVVRALVSVPASAIISSSIDKVYDNNERGGASIDSLVEGTKAASVVARMLHDPDLGAPVAKFWHEWGETIATTAGAVNDVKLDEHHLSGLQWAMDGFQSLQHHPHDEGEKERQFYTLPLSLQKAYDALDLPFRILPGCLLNIPNLSVRGLQEQVEFAVDEIQTTTSNGDGRAERVQERRWTAWQGDSERVGPFLYSGKSMPRQDWSPLVEQIRDELFHNDGNTSHGQYYNGCLLNLYPTGCSGMRYHVDPDQGSLWDYDTAVVSVGATRRFAFRRIHPGKDQQQLPHNFVVMHGDVTHMFGDCQRNFQHAVKNAEDKTETAPRISLVFKRTFT
jgi:alkylated DNA repair dioxygenase AlkB